MPAFEFDLKLLATITVPADDEAKARALLDELLNGADCNMGAWPDGSPIMATCSTDGHADLIEVDGVAV